MSVQLTTSSLAASALTADPTATASDTAAASMAPPALTRFFIRASISFKHGPKLAEGVDEIELIKRSDLSVRYERYRGAAITVDTQVDGVSGGGGWEKIAPAGILRVDASQAWAFPATGAEVSHNPRLVQLNRSQTVQVVKDRVARLIQSVVGALELATEAHCEVWRSEKEYGWETQQGVRYPVSYGSANITIMPGSVIGKAEQQRFEGLLDTLTDVSNASLRGAYAIARLNTRHFEPATRVVFGWALIERLVKSLCRGQRLSHRDIRDKAVHHCRAAVAQESAPAVDEKRIRMALKQAYRLRNGLAHGEPEAIAGMDFPALSRATTILARLLAHQSGRLKHP